jgi:hypothetical protein
VKHNFVHISCVSIEYLYQLDAWSTIQRQMNLLVG